MSRSADRARLICRWVTAVFASAYVAALAVYRIAELGLFGQPRDPLGGVFLIPLGLPWNLLVDRAPEGLWPWLAAAAPVINILLLVGLCRLGRNRPGQQYTCR
jgi:hypothetical protein